MNDHPRLEDEKRELERAFFHRLAELLDEALNEHVDSAAEQTGFVLLTFPMHEPKEGARAHFNIVTNSRDHAYVLEVMELAASGIGEATAREKASAPG
jgi:hypothetical protein